MKRAFALLALLALAAPGAAYASQALTFVGAITHLKGDPPTEFAVKGKTGTSSAVHTFFVDPDFAGVTTSMSGTKKHLGDLHAGMQVQVTYRKGLLGRLYALKVVIVNGFSIPMAQPSPH